MINEKINKRLQQLNNEDFILIIYVGLIILSLYSNIFERHYFIYNDQVSKNKYRNITIIIFSILVVVYLYFLKSSLEDIKNLKPSDSLKKRRLVYLSFFASLCIAISGFIFLYIAFVDQNIDIELAFN